MLLILPCACVQPAAAAPTDGSQQAYPQLNGLQHGCTPEDWGARSVHFETSNGQTGCMHAPADADTILTPENGGSDGDFLSDQRWTALRRIGEAAGWLVDPREVPSAWPHIMQHFADSRQRCVALLHCPLQQWSWQAWRRLAGMCWPCARRWAWSR